jgi:hypothetical protein
MTDELGQASRQVPRLFNSVFETGVRTVFVLVSIYPEGVDLEDLLALDHLVVHAEDVGGPKSLHPATATHATEMLVRRELIRDGLLLMQTKSMIDRIADERGLLYRAGDEAHNFVRYLASPYFTQLREAADYLAALRNSLGKTRFKELVDEQFERWAMQFQASEAPGTQS